MTSDRSGTRTWTADVSHIAEARRFVAGHLAANGRGDLAPDARLIVSELATNALMHAGTPFTVTLDVGDDAVLLRVTDGSAQLPVVGEPGLDQSGGRGLGIVAALAGAWGVTSEPGGGKSVWASIPTGGAGGPA
ncbi:ATP-binding protein [Nocardioides panacis]|uniref:ATP-binding protein n=1 Tax=Nocardioides panacis TaxID=2849501 RepID=A0A975T2R5_9ACTN|nr:ATP-binding protein [Nocardioides panacis]QWZ09819.1 ATP-binding protein [Nocardioides panacis]